MGGRQEQVLLARRQRLNPADVELLVKPGVDVALDRIQQFGGEGRRARLVRGIPEFGAPKLDEEGVALDFVENPRDQVLISAHPRLGKRQDEGVTGGARVSVQLSDVLGAEHALGVRAGALQIGAQCWQTAHDERKGYPGLLKPVDRRDEHGHRVLALSLVVVADDLRLVEQDSEALVAGVE